MKKLLRKLSLPLFMACVVVTTGCQIQEPPVVQEPLPDYREAFVGEFDFVWEYTSTNESGTTTKSETHTGLITVAGIDQINIEYRPSTFRRMRISVGGELTDVVAVGDSYNCNGSFSGPNAMSMVMDQTSNGSAIHLAISGIRK
jgi:hypothetical protein